VTRLAAEEFVLLTTYRRDGSAVPTPVWAVPLDAGLGIWTVADSGKVKRIRRDPTVDVAPCDRRGRARGRAVRGRARVLDAAGTERVRAAIRRKYGLPGRLGLALSRLRRGRDGTVGLAVDLYTSDE
jgi:PPOX class probable F420-dependent enzyme